MRLEFFEMANAIRSLSLDAIQSANSGHPGMALGMADVTTVLFAKFLKFHPLQPDWADRDRFVLSAGHGSMLLYSVLYLTGYEDASLSELKKFRQYGAKTAGHPEYGELKGIENTSGPLGQGLGNAIGMAIAEAVLRARAGQELVNHYTYVIAGDGCLMEGLGYESISIAGHLGLGNLILLFDDNSVSIDGPTDLTCSEDHVAIFKACGWQVLSIDGHSYLEIENAIKEARACSKPSLISCKTIIGKHMPNQGTSSAHSGAISHDEWVSFKNELGLPVELFALKNETLEMWRIVGKSYDTEYNEWVERLSKATHETQNLVSGNFDLSKVYQKLEDLQKQLIETPVSAEATRASSGRALAVVEGCLGNLLGGSADLTQSNCSKVNDMQRLERDSFKGNYIHYGVREHLMAACMNGIALHGGFIPYGGTFFVFTDYCRASIRLSALMNIKVIYIMTHDSIGVGEDGPTHQPVEHLASLRAMPGICVIRPADAVESIEAWKVALEVKGPVILVLSRQKNVQYRLVDQKNGLQKGAYILFDRSENTKGLDITLFATGSELGIAVDARKLLQEKHGLGVRVVSIPCWELFFEQPQSYQSEILDNTSFKLAIEAASGFGWEKIIGRKGEFVGMNSFGASAPFSELYSHFNITVEEVVKRCEKHFKV